MFCTEINLRSVVNKNKHSKTSRHNLRLPSNSRTVSHVLRRGDEGQADIKFFTRDIVGQVIDRIAVYPASRVSGRISRKAKFIVTSLGKLRKSYRPLIVRECSYSTFPIQKREYKSNNEVRRE